MDFFSFLEKGIAEFSFIQQKHKSSRKKKDNQRGGSHCYTPGRFTKTRLQGEGHHRHTPGLRLKHSRKGLRRIIAFGMARSRWAGGIYIFLGKIPGKHHKAHREGHIRGTGSDVWSDSFGGVLWFFHLLLAIDMPSGGYVRASYDGKLGVGNMTCAFDYLPCPSRTKRRSRAYDSDTGGSTKTGNWRCLRLYSLHTD